MKKTLIILIFIATYCCLIACASTPPSKTLPQSKVAVKSIDHSNYQKHLSSEIEQVKKKLDDALTFASEKEHAQTERLAQEILVDVELIRIKTQRLNVREEALEIEQNIKNLNEELKWREPIQVVPLN